MTECSAYQHVHATVHILLSLPIGRNESDFIKENINMHISFI